MSETPKQENSLKMPKFLPGRQRYEIDDDLNTISRAKMRSVQQTVVIVLTYFLSSTPFICAQLWAVWGKPSQAVSKYPLSNGDFTKFLNFGKKSKFSDSKMS